MPRYKLVIEYDGAPFVGWQVQHNGMSVQGALETAVTAFCGERVHVQGAGRTDAGVHALGQVAHIDLAKARDPDTVRDAINAHLRPYPVAVLAAEQAADDFDARFSARQRHYLYRIVNRRADLALDAGRAWRAPRPLDVDVHEIPARKGEPAHLHLDLRYLAVAPQGAVASRSVEETRDLRWFRFGDLGALDLDRGLRRGLGKVERIVGSA